MQNPNAMRYFFILSLFCFLTTASFAQVNNIWVDNDDDEGPGSFPTQPTMAISGAEFSSGVVRDDNSNVYVVGQFEKKLDASGGRRDAVYVYKYNSNGDLIWEADIYVSSDPTLSTPNQSYYIRVASGNSIAIGSDGIYVLASAFTTGGGGARNITFTSTSSPEIDNGVAKCRGVIAKYSFSGALLNRKYLMYENLNNCGCTCLE